MSRDPLRSARPPGRGGFLARLALAAAVATTGTVAGELPEDSVYRLDATLTDQSGQAFGFAEGIGQVRLATMFYATCPYVCPLIVEQIKRIEHELGDQERARLRVLLITLEVDKDTPEVLAAVAARRRVDTTRWTLARPKPSDLRKLSALLSVQYRKLPDGNFNHSSVINLIDRDGRVLARTSKLEGAPDPEFLAALRAALAEPDAAAP